MLGSFRRRNCTCKKKRCTCGSKWTYRYHIIDPKTGKRKQKETKGFDTKDEAEEEAKRILKELQDGVFIEKKAVTFEAFANEWLDSYEKSGKVKPSTVDIRRAKLKNLTEKLEKIKLQDISKQMYQKLLDEFAQTYARKTVASIHEVGRMIFSRAVELEVIAKDITEFAEIPRKMESVEDLEGKTELPRYLERDELNLFLHTAESDPCDYTLMLTLAYTGIRVGELCALKYRDIDFINQTISITKTIYRGTNGKISEFSLQTPKTKSSRRKIDVDEFVIKALGRHKENQKAINIDDRDNDFVFAYSTGTPYTIQYVLRRMRSILRSAKLPKNLSPHSLRHTHTSLLAEAGVDLEVIQNRLGHQSDRVTKLIYMHVTKPRRKEASQKFAELMRGI